MKIQKTVFYILMFLPLLAVMVALWFLPDQIPAHFGIDGQADRWGSKYETLVYPASSIVMGVIMLITAKVSSKQEGNGKNNEKITIILGIVSLLVFNVMTGYFLYVDFTLTEDISAVSVDLNSVMFAVLGVSLIVLGNVMPKLKRNSLIGVRTSKTLSSETVWRKSQRFGGICMIVGGAGVVITSIFTRSTLCMAVSLGIILAVALACVIYSFSVKE